MNKVELTSAEVAMLFALAKYIEKDSEEQEDRLYPLLRNFAEILLVNEAFAKFGRKESDGSAPANPTEEQIHEFVEKTWLNRDRFYKD